MTAHATAEIVRSIVARRLGIAEAAVDGDAPIKDLGASSLVLMELIVELEQTFQVRLHDDIDWELVSVADLANFVQALPETAGGRTEGRAGSAISNSSPQS